MKNATFIGEHSSDVNSLYKKLVKASVLPSNWSVLKLINGEYNFDSSKSYPKGTYVIKYTSTGANIAQAKVNIPAETPWDPSLWNISSFENTIGGSSSGGSASSAVNDRADIVTNTLTNIAEANGAYGSVYKLEFLENPVEMVFNFNKQDAYFTDGITSPLIADVNQLVIFYIDLMIFDINGKRYFTDIEFTDDTTIEIMNQKGTVIKSINPSTSASTASLKKFNNSVFYINGSSISGMKFKFKNIQFKFPSTLSSIDDYSIKIFDIYALVL